PPPRFLRVLRFVYRSSRRMKSMRKTLKAVMFLSAMSVCLPAIAQQTSEPPAVRPARVDLTPARIEAEVGQTVKFTVAAFDEEGHKLDLKPTAWFAAPFDSAAAVDQNGSVVFYAPGEIRVGAIVGGKPGFATVIVKPQSVARIDVEPVNGPIAVGAGVKLTAVARTPNGDPRADADIEWRSSTPAIASVDA